MLGGAEPESQLGQCLDSPWGVGHRWRLHPLELWKAGGLQHDFKLMRPKCEPHCCLSACSLKPVFTKLPSEALEVQPGSDAHPDSPSRPPQPGKGGGLFVGILNGSGYLSGGEIISHTKFKLPFLREKADWNKPLTVLLSQAFCQWLAH